MALEHKSSTPDRAWIDALVLGSFESRRFRPNTLATIGLCAGRTQSGTILDLFLSRFDRHDRFLGYALAQYSRFLPLRRIATRPGPRPNAWVAFDNGSLRFHRRGCNFGHRDHL